jgi:preprotein translocase subunit SecG
MYIIQIIIAATLVTLVLLQSARGGGLGGLFGGSEGGVYKTRRGVERTMFQATIVLSALFFIVAIVTVLVAR